jgi:hypothetical protein
MHRRRAPAQSSADVGDPVARDGLLSSPQSSGISRGPFTSRAAPLIRRVIASLGIRPPTCSSGLPSQPRQPRLGRSDLRRIPRPALSESAEIVVSLNCSRGFRNGTGHACAPREIGTNNWTAIVQSLQRLPTHNDVQCRKCRIGAEDYGRRLHRRDLSRRTLRLARGHCTAGEGRGHRSRDPLLPNCSPLPDRSCAICRAE